MTCSASMVLPPQSEGRRLLCQLPMYHGGLHSAEDADGIMRRWPDSGPAGAAAGACNHCGLTGDYPVNR
jgi:hypothetical protein